MSAFFCDGPFWRAEFDVQVGIFSDGVEVFWPVGHVQSDEGRVWVFFDDVVALVKQSLLGRKRRAVEAPAGILHQLFVAFVVFVGWCKERLRIGHMDGNRDAKAATLFPDGIDPRIIDGHQLSRFIFYAQPQVLQNFQSAAAALYGVI